MTKPTAQGRHDLSGEPPGRLGWAVAIVIVVLVAVNVIDIRVAHASLVLGPVGAAGFLAIARWAGLSWQELGLGRGTWRRGLIWAAGAIGAVAVVFALGAALPLTRDAFRDARYDLTWDHALLTAFLLIPLGTVLFEEVAFRGVLWGLLRRGRGTLTATVVSSALFGVWHVLPSLGLATDNQAIGSAVGKGTSGEAISVLGTSCLPPCRGCVLRAAPPQRQPARVDRTALGDERARCSYGRVHLGMGFPMTRSGPATSRPR